MERAPGQNSGRSLLSRPFEALGFITLAGMSMGILAAVVLLPTYEGTAAARQNLAEVTAKVQLNDRLIEYNERLIDQIKRNPALTQQLLIDQQGFSRPYEVTVHIEQAAEDPPLPVMLAAQAGPRIEQPKPASAKLTRLAKRLTEPRVRRGLLVVAAVLMTCAMVMFSPSLDNRRREKGR